MTILDSNVWISYFHEPDSRHKHARTLFKQIDGLVLVPEYIVVETCTVLNRVANKEVVIKFLDRTMNNRDIRVAPTSRQLFYQLIDFYTNHDHHQLSFIDVSLLFLSQYHTVHTFDKKLKRAIEKRKVRA